MNTRHEQFHLGIAGACGRGRSFRVACDALPRVRVHAVCDIDTGALPATAELLGASEQYVGFGEMLERSDLDGVIIATPMPLHASQAIDALDRGLHVFSEVPAAISIEECRGIVRAAKASGGVYMMGENYTYIRENVLVKELVKAGHFGTPYYAEGEYLHELKGYDEQRLAARGLPPEHPNPILPGSAGRRARAQAARGTRSGASRRTLRGRHAPAAAPRRPRRTSPAGVSRARPPGSADRSIGKRASGSSPTRSRVLRHDHGGA